jgi:hypothetical protein
MVGVLAAGGLVLRSRLREIPPPAAQAPAPAVAVPAAQPLPKDSPRPLPVKKFAPAQAAPPAKGAALVPVAYPQLEQAFPPEGYSGADCAGKRVILTLTVGVDGSVQACRILTGAAPPCAEAARKAAMRYRFRPALDSGGRPVKAATTIALEFPENP